MKEVLCIAGFPGVMAYGLWVLLAKLVGIGGM